MDKVTVSAAEIAEATVSLEQPSQVEAKLPPAVPAWARWSLAPLVVVLPLLCLMAIIFRIATRTLPPRAKHEWTSFLATLLIVSGLLTSIASVLVFSLAPLPSMAAAGLGELDERGEFPKLPVTAAMSAKEVSETMKPLVAVITPARRSWLTHEEMPTASFGAGTLLQANSEGYLFATARHVVDSLPWHSVAQGRSRALIAMASGSWGTAEVVARHKTLDLLLLWVPRHVGSATFVQPIAKSDSSSDGENVFVIGHPEGLRFTLSTGIISRIAGDIIQISAPVSPGNSGGPVFDDHGYLLGIVTSMVDKRGDPNAENLNFAVSAESLLSYSNWDFDTSGNKRLTDYITTSGIQQKTVPAEGQR